MDVLLGESSRALRRLPLEMAALLSLFLEDFVALDDFLPLGDSVAQDPYVYTKETTLATMFSELG